MNWMRILHTRTQGPRETQRGRDPGVSGCPCLGLPLRSTEAAISYVEIERERERERERDIYIHIYICNTYTYIPVFIYSHVFLRCSVYNYADFCMFRPAKMIYFYPYLDLNSYTVSSMPECTSVYVCLYVCMYECMYVCMYVCMMYVCVCMYVCMHVCMCICGVMCVFIHMWLFQVSDLALYRTYVLHVCLILRTTSESSFDNTQFQNCMKPPRRPL